MHRTLKVDEIYTVLQEAGHPSMHDGLPVHVDEGEDCLLLVRRVRETPASSSSSKTGARSMPGGFEVEEANVQGEVGWALASFLRPLG